MYAVSASESRIGGKVSVDSASGFTFGNRKFKLTARGRNWTNWQLPHRCQLRYRPSYYPQASGHGHLA